MESVKRWQRECVAKEIVDILNKRHYTAYYADSKEEARQKVLDLIPEGSTIGLGGSVTLQELDLMDEFKKDCYKMIDRYAPVPWEETLDRYREGLAADVFVCSTNAITRDGELVNMDSTGNRVAAISFGPKKVVIVAGVNKVVDTLYDALDRVKKIAPMNAKRLGHTTPCTVNNECVDCENKGRMCNSIGIITNDKKFEGRIHIIIVPEVLGY